MSEATPKKSKPNKGEKRKEPEPEETSAGDADTQDRAPPGTSTATASGARVTTQEQRQGAVGGVDTGGTGNIAILGDGKPTTKGHTYLTFKTNFKFYSHALAKVKLVTGTGMNTVRYLTTSMCALPSDLLPMYMSEAQYNMLPIETYAVSATQKLYLLHCRTNFQANASDVTTATQNHQLYVDYGKGLENNWNIRVGTIDVDSAHPMVPTTFTPVPNDSKWITENLIPRLWGNADLSDISPPATTGKFVPWDLYTAPCTLR